MSLHSRLAPDRLLRSLRQLATMNRQRPIIETLESRTLLSQGLMIAAVTPTQVINATLDHVDVTFNEAINPTTFTTNDVSLTGGGSFAERARGVPVADVPCSIRPPPFGGFRRTSRSPSDALTQPPVAELGRRPVLLTLYPIKEGNAALAPFSRLSSSAGQPHGNAPVHESCRRSALPLHC